MASDVTPLQRTWSMGILEMLQPKIIDITRLVHTVQDQPVYWDQIAVVATLACAATWTGIPRDVYWSLRDQHWPIIGFYEDEIDAFRRSNPTYGSECEYYHDGGYRSSPEPADLDYYTDGSENGVWL